MRAPLCVDLFCGTFAWSEGWRELGGRVIGYDIEHLPHHGPVPERADLILQDVHTIDGRRLKEADLILASPPCQAFSWRGMPWKAARAKHPKELCLPVPEWWKLSEEQMSPGNRSEWEAWKVRYPREEPSRALFDACFRIQREASEAKGEHIPMVVENVRSAQRWLGKARGSFGSFFLWGDVPILLPKPHKARKVPGFRFDGSGGSFQTAAVEGTKVAGVGAGWKHPSDPRHVPGLAFNTLAERATKNEGGSWFAVANNTTSGHSKNPVHEAQKTIAHVNRRDGHGHTRHLTNHAEHDAVKFSQSGAAWFDGTPKSSARKAASARIAKIPLRLGRHIAAFYYPEPQEQTA